MWTRSFEAGELLEQFAGEVAHRAGAGRAVGQLARIGLGVGDELLERLRRHRGVNDDRGGRDREQRDRHKVLDRIVRHLRHGHRVEHHRAGAAENERVAVGRRARDLGGRDGAGGAALVLDVDGAEQVLHPVGPLPADHVVHAAGRERHHQLDRPVGITPRRTAATTPSAKPRPIRVSTRHDGSCEVAPYSESSVHRSDHRTLRPACHSCRCGVATRQDR